MHVKVCMVFALASACAIWALSAGAAPSRSESVQIVTTADCLHWNTIRQSNPVLRWEWPSEAGSAVVTVSVSTRAAGRPKTVDYVVERGVSDLAAWTLPVDLPSLDQDTGVVTVELEFHAEAGGTGATVSGAVKSNTLGLVRGISGEPLCVLACDKTEECWSRKETLRGAVVSVLSGTTSLAIDDTAVELAGVPGWAYAFLPARRTVALECSAGSQSSSAVLYREGSGMVMLLR